MLFDEGCCAFVVTSTATVIAGILHFTKTDFFVSIVPSFLPFPAALGGKRKAVADQLSSEDSRTQFSCSR
jgi:hypothetical protein